MAFLRVKKINNAKYLYIVGNKWYKRKAKGKGKGPRQKVIKYLGKVYSFEKANNSDFHYFKNINNIEEYIKNNEKSSIIRDLVEWELFRHHINKDEFGIDFDNKKILKGKKDVSLAMNEGFLCSYTLARLFNFKFGIEMENEGMEFAKAFVEAGIEVPKEVFVGIFGKVYK